MRNARFITQMFLDLSLKMIGSGSPDQHNMLVIHYSLG